MITMDQNEEVGLRNKLDYLQMELEIFKEQIIVLREEIALKRLEIQFHRDAVSITGVVNMKQIIHRIPIEFSNHSFKIVFTPYKADKQRIG